MKPFIAVPLAWLLWLLGHIIHYLVFYLGVSSMYSTYNGLMRMSSNVQDWGGYHGNLAPWYNTKEE